MGQLAMDLDELKDKWAEYDRKLNENLRLNRQFFKATRLSRVRSALRRFAIILGLEAPFWFLCIVALGHFLYRHITLLRFALPAAILDLYVIANFAALSKQIMDALHINYEKPITAIQKEVESLHVLRLRYIWVSIVGGFVVWIPFVIVIFKGFFGLDAYRLLNTAWIIANVLFGLGIAAVAIWLSRNLSERMSHHPGIQRFMRNLAGHNINKAREFLAALSEFENE